MAIVSKITFLFNGAKLDAIGPQFQPASARPGGVAQGSEGPIDQFAGMAETHGIDNVTFWIRPNGLSFVPWEHTLPGQEFEVQFVQGDPLFGGKVITFQDCLCEGETTVVDNGSGECKVTVPKIRAVRRVPSSR